MNIWKKCLGILFPQTCYFCGRIGTEPMCPECRKKVEYIEEPRCKRCGKPIRYQEKEFCHDCTEKEFFYEQGRSIWLHKGPVKWSVYQFKYKNRRVYAEYYAEECYRLYARQLKEWKIDLIVPVPLHKRRRRKRGYNQAEILACQLGRLSGIPVSAKSVVRMKNTRPQKELNDKERKKNLHDAFGVIKTFQTTRNVLIVDDIYTTGNTINSMARSLKEKGVEKVYFLTISIGQGF